MSISLSAPKEGLLHIAAGRPSVHGEMHQFFPIASKEEKRERMKEDLGKEGERKERKE